jgi:hypothetical protein
MIPIEKQSGDPLGDRAMLRQTQETISENRNLEKGIRNQCKDQLELNQLGL